MTLRRLLRIVCDPDAIGGASADGSICLNTLPTVQFEGFPLAGSTAYAAVTDTSGNVLSDSVLLEICGAGSAATGTLPFTDSRIEFWLAGKASTTIRVGLFTQTDGWLGFANITLQNMPAIPDPPASA